MEIGIGTTLYQFDINTRVYTNDDGTRSAGPIFEKYFRPVKVTGETKVSWVLENGMKANKKTLDCARAYEFGGRGILTAEQMADKIWENKYKLKLISELQAASVETLKEVARIMRGKCQRCQGWGEIAYFGELAVCPECKGSSPPAPYTCKHSCERDSLKDTIETLVSALEGVIRVADRKTVEFDAARAAIAKSRAST